MTRFSFLLARHIFCGVGWRHYLKREIVAFAIELNLVSCTEYGVAEMLGRDTDQILCEYSCATDIVCIWI